MSKDIGTGAGRLNAEQVAAALSQPPVFVNKFYINANPDIVRIAFLDEPSAVSFPGMRGVMVMSRTDAMALATVLLKTLREVDEKLNPGLYPED